MKAFCYLLCACVALPLSGDVATSKDYELTIVSFDGGGGHMVSRTYDCELAISQVAGRQVAQQSAAINWGYAAQLNNPPMAFDDIRSHPFEMGTDILHGVLLGNDVDPDFRDKLRVHSVTGGTQAGGTVALTGTHVRYFPPSGFAGVDRFSYTIADVAGDVSTADVTMFVAPAATVDDLNRVRAYRQADGKILLRFAAGAGRSEYIIEHATDMELQDWRTLIVANAGADGVVEIIVDPSQGPEGYYRAVVF